MLSEADILREFEESGAMLHGHFILSSGLHSPIYMQCARVLMEAKRAEKLCKELAERVVEQLGGWKLDAIVSPAMGGVVVGYEMGRQLKLPAMFCERVDGSFALRRGFSVEPAQRVLIVEDVVTTGKSSMEAVECVRAHGAEPLAVASLVDRRAGNDTTLKLPLVSLLKLTIPTYTSTQLPDSLKAVPAVKPGSRELKAG